MLSQNESRLLGVDTAELGAAVADLSVGTILQADRLHESAKVLCSASPKWLQQVCTYT